MDSSEVSIPFHQKFSWRLRLFHNILSHQKRVEFKMIKFYGIFGISLCDYTNFSRSYLK